MKCSWVYRLLFRKGGTRMKKYSATVRYLVNQILMNNLTYLQVTTSRNDLKPDIDGYINQEGIEIDKTI